MQLSEPWYAAAYTTDNTLTHSADTARHRTGKIGHSIAMCFKTSPFQLFHKGLKRMPSCVRTATRTLGTRRLCFERYILMQYHTPWKKNAFH